MHKIGTTVNGSILVEVTEAEFESLRALLAKRPERGSRLAWDAIHEEKKRFAPYQYRSLQRMFAPTAAEDSASITVSALLARLKEDRPFGFSPQMVRKLKGILELKIRNT